MVPEKKEVADTDTKNAVLRRLILDKLSNINRQKFCPESIDHLSLAFRVFLLRYCNLNYEFTEDELAKELDRLKIPAKLKRSIIAVINSLTEIKYEGKSASSEDFKAMIREAEEIVKTATGEKEKKESPVKKEAKEKKENALYGFLHKIGFAHTEEEKGKLEAKRKAEAIESGRNAAEREKKQQLPKKEEKKESRKESPENQKAEEAQRKAEEERTRQEQEKIRLELERKKREVEKRNKGLEKQRRLERLNREKEKRTIRKAIRKRR